MFKCLLALKIDGRCVRGGCVPEPDSKPRKIAKIPHSVVLRNIPPLSIIRKPHKMLKRRVHIMKYYLAASVNNTLSKIIQLEK